MDSTRRPSTVAEPDTEPEPEADSVKVVADGTVTELKVSAALPAFRVPATLPPDTVAAELEAMVLATSVSVDEPVRARVPAQSWMVKLYGAVSEMVVV